MAGTEAVTEATSKSFVPDLFKAELKAGEWMFTSKLSIATFMRPGNPLDVRIQACLMLHSWGYSSHLAVFQKKGKFKGDLPIKLPLGPFGIRRLLGDEAIKHYEESAPKGTPRPDPSAISRRFMGNTLAKMDDDGIIDRCRRNCEEKKLIGLSYAEAQQKGLVTPVRDLSPLERKKLNRLLVVYLLAKPRKAKVYDAGEVHKFVDLDAANPLLINTDNRAVQLVLGFVHDAEIAARLARRDDVRREIAAYDAARDGFQAAKLRLQQYCEAVAKAEKEQNQKGAAKLSKNPDQQPTLFNGEDLVSKPRSRAAALSEVDVATVLEAMRHAGSADEPAAQQLIAACRSHSAQASAVLIAEAVESKVLIARRKDNPPGFLIVSVPKLFVGAGFKAATPAPAPAGPVCEGCGVSLEGRGSRDRLCFACLDKQEARATA